MKRSNTPANSNKPVDKTKPKIHPLGSSILDRVMDVETGLMQYTDGFRWFKSIKGGKS